VHVSLIVEAAFPLNIVPSKSKKLQINVRRFNIATTAQKVANDMRDVTVMGWKRIRLGFCQLPRIQGCPATLCLKIKEAKSLANGEASLTCREAFGS
jgi:hypothetical protein